MATKPSTEGLHKFLDFDGAIMTDSGAYQILVYGEVEVSQKEIVAYQEGIGSDIATMLDIPTGWKITKEKPKQPSPKPCGVQKTFLKSKSGMTFYGLDQFRAEDTLTWLLISSGNGKTALSNPRA